MKSSCISHPEKEPILIIRKWQIDATGDNCAAALLSFFEYWHNWKLDGLEKAKQANHIARGHGDEGSQDETLYQFHTSQQLKAGIMGLYSDDKIRNGISILVQLGFITLHKNPNPRYKFDNTKFFLFHDEKVMDFLRLRKTPTPSPKNRERSPENRETIPKTTNKDYFKDTKGDFRKSLGVRPYPKSEAEMKLVLEFNCVDYEPDYDGDFWNEMQRSKWTLNGEPIFDWVKLYISRVEHAHNCSRSKH